MTPEETQQVQTYIAGLNTQHQAAISAMQNACTQHIEQLIAKQKIEAIHNDKARRVAQNESLQMGKALVEIVKVCETQPHTTASEVVVVMRQILNYYCEDYDIPF